MLYGEGRRRQIERSSKLRWTKITHSIVISKHSSHQQLVFTIHSYIKLSHSFCHQCLRMSKIYLLLSIYSNVNNIISMFFLQACMDFLLDPHTHVLFCVFMLSDTKRTCYFLMFSQTHIILNTMKLLQCTF